MGEQSQNLNLKIGMEIDRRHNEYILSRVCKMINQLSFCHCL